MSDPATGSRPRRKVRDGIVISDRMEKTVVVVVPEMKAHPLYKKVVRRSTRLMAHDEQGQCAVGDRVRLRETRPLSRRKRWRVDSIIEKAR